MVQYPLTDEYKSAVLKVLLQKDGLVENNVVALKLSTVVGRVDDLLLLLAFPETTHKGTSVVGLVCLATGCGRERDSYISATSMQRQTTQLCMHTPTTTLFFKKLPNSNPQHASALPAELPGQCRWYIGLKE